MNWKDIAVSPETPIENAIRVIENTSLRIALVVDENSCLQGTVTNGDIRQGLLNGMALDSPVKNIFYITPLVGSVDNDKDAILQFMEENNVNQLPVVDRSGKMVRFEVLEYCA